MNDYHGFTKSRFPDHVLAKILEPYEMNPEDVQAELVAVQTELSIENHVHKDAHAITTILGEQEHLDNPRKVFAFRIDSWFPVRPGDALDIHPTTPHTFTVNPGGILYFLCVQSPPN